MASNKKKSTVPAGNHPMQRTMAARARQRQQFATWLNGRLDELGVPLTVGKQTYRERSAWLAARGVNRDNARAWLNGQAAPHLHTLPALAEILDVDLAQVCVATGRPPSQAARFRYVADRTGAVSTLVHDWRARLELTHAQLADLTGVSAGTLSRLEAGSRVDISAPVAVTIADAMGVPAAVVAAGCRTHPDVPEPLDGAVAGYDTELAALLRISRKRSGLNAADAARLLHLSEHSLAGLESGRRTPSEFTCFYAAVTYGLALHQLLLSAGHAETLTAALSMAQVLESAAYQVATVSFAEAFDAERKRSRMTRDALAEAAGVSRFDISRYANGPKAPGTVARVIQLAAALRTRPEPLVAAWANAA